MFSGFANGITMADQWRITADTNTGTDADVTTNWERADDPAWGGIGTGLTESSGIFSFPQTGIYLILSMFNLAMTSDGAAGVQLSVTTDNSSYTADARGYAGIPSGTLIYGITSFQTIIDVTDITQVKFKLATTSFSAGTVIKGNTNMNQSGFTCIRLGDT
jgi:hypothetical protein